MLFSDAIVQLILGGLISGALAGLLGIGGGIILVPLIITLGYTAIQAVATSSLVIVISSTSGSIQNWRMGYLDFKRVIYLAMPALITAQLGVYLGTLIPAYLLLFLFSILLLINIYLIQLKKKLKSQQQVSSKTKSQRSLILSRLLTGSLGGLMAGLFGMGGGIIFVPFQMLLLGEPIKLAIQTSLGAIIVTSVSACIGHATNGNVLFVQGGILGAGGLVGSQFSTRILPKLPDTVVSLIFRVFLAVLSLYMFWQSWDSYRQESGVKFQEFIRGFFQVDFNLPSLFSPLALILFFSVLLNLFFLWLLVSRYYRKLSAKNTVRTSNFLTLSELLPQTEQKPIRIWEQKISTIPRLLKNYHSISRASKLQSTQSPSLERLFIIFAKLGSVAFGGGMAMVAHIEITIVSRLKLLTPEDMLDCICVSTILPGPIPANVVVYIGTRLRGIQGALVCLIATILPAFILIVGMAELYWRSGNLPAVDQLIMIIVPAASANIANMAIKNTAKAVRSKFDLCLIVASICFLLSIKSVYTPIAIIFTTGLLRYIEWQYSKPKVKFTTHNYQQKKYKNILFVFSLILALMVLGTFAYCAFLPNFASNHLYLKILTTFAGIGLMLFGGAYVSIPLMEHILVHQLDWVSAKEFTITLLLGQITPGPWTVSTAFVGYKIGHLPGAMLSIIGLFLPSLILGVFGSRLLDRLKSLPVTQKIMTGIRPVIVGMIYYAAWVVAKGIEIGWSFIAIFLTTLLILQFNRCKTWLFHWQYSTKVKLSQNSKSNRSQTYFYQLPRHIQQKLEALLIRKIGAIAIILLEQSIERKITYQEFFEKLSIFIPPKSLIWEEIWDLLRRHIPTTQIINCSFTPQSNYLPAFIPEKINIEFLAACRTELEKAIGPIAKYVIREQIAKNPNLSKIQLIEALVAQIPDHTIAREFRHRFATI